MTESYVPTNHIQDPYTRRCARCTLPLVNILGYPGMKDCIGPILALVRNPDISGISDFGGFGKPALENPVPYWYWKIAHNVYGTATAGLALHPDGTLYRYYEQISDSLKRTHSLFSTVFFRYVHGLETIPALVLPGPLVLPSEEGSGSGYNKKPRVADDVDAIQAAMKKLEYDRIRAGRPCKKKAENTFTHSGCWCVRPDGSTLPCPPDNEQ